MTTAKQDARKRGKYGKTSTVTLGMKVGRLTVVEPVHWEGPDFTGAWWTVCDCSCGTKGYKIRAYSLIKAKPSKSCGCISREMGMATRELWANAK